MDRAKKKWVDDLMEAMAINLSEATVRVDEASLVRPFPWHARTEHVLPDQNNPAQKSLKKLVEASSEVEMVMNTKKTKTMIFSRMRKTDVEPFIRLEDDKVVEYTDKTKLLGVVINEKLSSWDNTKYIESKAYRRI